VGRRLAPRRHSGSVRVKEGVFFFAKKNQKTFIRYFAYGGAVPEIQTDRSLFASFSSEKEDFLPSPNE
jgi:hypothetical protein